MVRSGSLAISFLFVGAGIALNSSLANAQNGVSPPKIAVTLATEPSPAHKGGNTVRVKLTDSAGQPMLFSDRTSTHYLRSNQLRLYFSSIAYVLLQMLRRLGLAGTELAKA